MTGVEMLDALGDVGLLLSLAAALAAWLLSSRPFAALWLAGAMIFCAAATSLLKIYLHACPMIPLLRGPSGHVSFATLIYGALVAVIFSRYRGWVRLSLASAGILIVAAVAVARFILDAHNLPEIAFGLGIGTLSLALFAFGYRRTAAENRSVKALMAAVAVLVLVVYGHHLNGERFVDFLAFDGETAHFSLMAACPRGVHVAEAME
jgi:hypothetical protein